MKNLFNIKVGDYVECLEDRRNARVTIGNFYKVVKVKKGYTAGHKQFLIKTDTGASHWVNVKEGRFHEGFNLKPKDEDERTKKISELSIADLVAISEGLMDSLNQEQYDMINTEINNRLDYIFN